MNNFQLFVITEDKHSLKQNRKISVEFFTIIQIQKKDLLFGKIC